ncbi:erythromycin esterase family protein [Embleya sp. NPDC008237]|uniref:erythromycin esterase family protein n=1 Tax=Embleya sp. NPDC008237 TaxID=3363978 RepID=UPI0036ECEBB7
MKSDDFPPPQGVETRTAGYRHGPGSHPVRGPMPVLSPWDTTATAPTWTATPFATPTTGATSRGDPVSGLARSAYTLGSTVPGGSGADLRAFDTMVRGADVVAVGAATYGSSEFCTVKHRLFRHLVEGQGFRSFVFGASWDAGVRLDAWVLRGTGHLRTIMDEEFRAGSGQWNTTETRDLFRWMRTWNVRHPESPVRVAGNGADHADSALPGPTDEAALRHRDRGPADTTLWWQRHTGTKVFLSAHNSQVAAGPALPDRRPATLGRLLREHLGSRYVNVGFTFGQGSFNAIDANAPGTPWRRFDVGPAMAHGSEDVLERVSRRDWYLDTRAVAAGTARNWLAAARPTRNIGAYRPCGEYEDTRLLPTHDIIVHLHHIGPTHRR